MALESSKYSFTQRKERKRKFLIGLVSLLFVLLFVHLLVNFVIRSFGLSSDCMNPNIPMYSRFFVAPLFENSLTVNEDSLKRGSIVTVNNKSVEKKTMFEATVDFVVGMLSLQQYRLFEQTRWGDSDVYRVIGIPGDILYMDDFIAHLKPLGEPHFLTEFELIDVEYNVLSDTYPEGWNMSIGIQGKTKEIMLKEGEYFLLCDNRVVTTDSRLFGPVSIKNITAKAILQYFPFRDFRVLP